MGACSSKKPITQSAPIHIKIQEPVQEYHVQPSNRSDSVIDNLVINEEDNKQTHRQQEPIVTSPLKQVELSQEDVNQLKKDAPSSVDLIESHRVECYLVEEQALNDTNEDAILEQRINKPLETMNFVNTGMAVLNQRNQNDVQVLQKQKQLSNHRAGRENKIFS